MVNKEHIDDDELEKQARFIIEHLAKYILNLFSVAGVFFDRLHQQLSIDTDIKNKFVKPSVFSPFGLLLIIAGIYYLLQIETIFAPFYIVYFFLFVMLIGFFFIKHD